MKLLSRRRPGPPYLRWLSGGFIYFILFIFAGLYLAHVTPFTGDESRYLYYSKSLLDDSVGWSTAQDWNGFLKKRMNIPAYGDEASWPIDQVVLKKQNVPTHSIAVPVIVAAVVNMFPSYPVERYLSILLACITLFLIGSILFSRAVSVRWIIAVLVVSGASLPFLAYSAVFAPEIWAACAISAGLYGLMRPVAMRNAIVIALIIVGLPFIHFRGIAGSAALFAGLVLWILAPKPGGHFRAIWAVSIGIPIVGAGFFLIVNGHVYGNFLGSVGAVRPTISLDAINSLFAGFRHGVLVYAPVVFFSLLGLLRLSLSRDLIGSVSLLGLILTVLLSTGSDPGETAPARFFVQAVPFSAIGLGFFFERISAQFIFVKVIFFAAVIWTLSNGFYYLTMPARFFENRQQCLTCGDLVARLVPTIASAKFYYRVTHTSASLGDVESFPASRDVYQVDLVFKKPINIDAVSVRVVDGGGEWTTLPIGHLWGLALFHQTGQVGLLNRGGRVSALGLRRLLNLSLAFPDNGALSRCAPIEIELTTTESRRHSVVLSCIGNLPTEVRG